MGSIVKAHQANTERAAAQAMKNMTHGLELIGNLLHTPGMSEGEKKNFKKIRSSIRRKSSRLSAFVTGGKRRKRAHKKSLRGVKTGLTISKS